MKPAQTSTNRMALFSFMAAIITLISFCIGFLPIPLTGWVCYPLAALTGGTALFTGIRALKILPHSSKNSRLLAKFGIWTGTLTILAVTCLSTLTALLMYYGLENLIKNWWK